MADTEAEEPSDGGEYDDDSRFASVARIADDLAGSIVELCNPEHRATGKFVILVDALNVRTGQRVEEPYFVVPLDQVEWETRGLLNWASSQDLFSYGDYEEPDYPE